MTPIELAFISQPLNLRWTADVADTNPLQFVVVERVSGAWVTIGHRKDVMW